MTEQKDRNFIFWQRDPLAILITSKKMAGEKLDYMPARHVIPVLTDHPGEQAGILIHFNHIGSCAKIQLSTGFLPRNFMRQEMMNLRY